MKLAVAIEVFNPQGGGAERSTYQIVCELVRLGHEVHVLCASSENADGLKDVHVHVLPGKGKLDRARMFAFSAFVKDHLSSNKYDSSLSVTTSAPAAVVQPRSGTAVATQKHNLLTTRSPLQRSVRQLLGRFNRKRRALVELEAATFTDPTLKGIAAVSQFVVRQLEEHYPSVITEKTVKVIPNTAVMPNITDEQRAEYRLRIRDMFKIKDTQTAYAFVAMNPKLKGIYQLLDAFTLYRQHGGDGVLMLAGEIGSKYLNIAEKLGIRGHVRHIGRTEKMAELYCAADVTVLPSFYDPSSKVVIESLMLGVPAISTAWNGASDFIHVDGEPKRGRVVNDPRNIEALSQALLDLDSPDVRAECKANIGDLAEQLSIQNHVRQLVELMDEVSSD